MGKDRGGLPVNNILPVVHIFLLFEIMLKIEKLGFLFVCI